MPCSFGEIGYGSARPMSSKLLDVQLHAARRARFGHDGPGHADGRLLRGAVRRHSTTPRRLPSSTTTHCRKPLPSRTIGNCSFPEVRLLYSQPLTVTVSPTCCGNSLIRTVVAIRRRIIGSSRAPLQTAGGDDLRSRGRATAPGGFGRRRRLRLRGALYRV